MRLICELIERLADCDGHTLSKAHEYTDNIQRMAEAVEQENEEELRRQYEILNKRPFL